MFFNMQWGWGIGIEWEWRSKVECGIMKVKYKSKKIYTYSPLGVFETSIDEEVVGIEEDEEE